MEDGGDPHSAWSLFGFAKRLGAAETEKAVASYRTPKLGALD